MEKRTVLALVLVALVILLTPKLFPGNRVTSPVVESDSNANVLPLGKEAEGISSVTATKLSKTTGTSGPNIAGQLATSRIPTAEKLTIGDTVSSFALSNIGAMLERVSLPGFRDLSRKNSSVLELTAGATPVLSYRVVTSRDTINLRDVVFTGIREDDHTVSYRASVEDAQLMIHYAISPDSFLVRVSGTISTSDSLGEPRFLLIDLPETLNSFEADTVDDQRHLAFAYYTRTKSAKSLPFGKLDPGEKQFTSGPLTWVVVKSKYFLVGLLSDANDPMFAEFSAIGGARTSKTTTHARGTVVNRVVNGGFRFEIYAGPQQWRRLSALGRDFQNSNPYGGFLQPVVQPFATIVMKILLWMRENLKISYGWVLIIFGIAVRLILWPLNQKGMRASMKMQRIQPQLNEIQKRFKGDPPKMQSEMMRVYKEHDMSPFSTFAGCLPLFLPLPILFALFFVFQNTIEFRGVAFLWFPDISQKDPYYIVPLSMGISMFVLSWISMRNTPPNPQTKAMTYIFPVMMTVLFANFAAGLNMYYTIQNLAALPQQWLIANERAKNAVTRA
jgi:YidC/Oxa1 family membrane protein insertase